MIMVNLRFIGSIMDIYASGQDQLIRIDLFDDEIESLKFFDPETQRTTESLKTFTVLPAKEFPIKRWAFDFLRSLCRKFSHCQS